jgi:hypothetical protein
MCLYEYIVFETAMCSKELFFVHYNFNEFIDELFI